MSIKKRFKRWLINWLLEGQFNGLVVANNTITDSELTNISMNIETLYLNGEKFKNVKLVFELNDY